MIETHCLKNVIYFKTSPFGFFQGTNKNYFDKDPFQIWTYPDKKDKDNPDVIRMRVRI